MHFFTPLLSFTRLDHQRNSYIRESLEATDVVEKIKGCEQKWRDHSKGMERDCLLQLAFRGAGLTFLTYNFHEVSIMFFLLKINQTCQFRVMMCADPYFSLYHTKLHF
jgi:hypothetical protein